MQHASDAGAVNSRGRAICDSGVHWSCEAALVHFLFLLRLTACMHTVHWTLRLVDDFSVEVSSFSSRRAQCSAMEAVLLHGSGLDDVNHGRGV
jgi:hypothetical protein